METMEIRVLQNGDRDASTNLKYRADESGGWIWEATHALEAALVAEHGDGWSARRILELGSGTPPRSLPWLAAAQPPARHAHRQNE